MIRKLSIVVALLGFMVGMSACESEEEHLRHKAEVVKICVDSGGEWYFDDGFGESCHFDSRKAK